MRRNKQWSIDELIYLKNNPKLPARVIGERLGRTTGGVQFMRTKLKSDPDLIKNRIKGETIKRWNDTFNDDAVIEYFKENKIARRRHKPLRLEIGARYSFYRNEGTGTGDYESAYVERVEGVVLKEYKDYYLIQCKNYKTTIYKHCGGYTIRRLRA